MRRVASFVLILSAALGLELLPLASAAQAKPKLRLTGYDRFATPGEAVTCRFKAERFRFIRWDVRRAPVDLYLYRADLGTWSALGRAISAGDGYADLQIQAPPVAGNHYVAARAAGRYRSDWAYLLLCVRDAGSRFIVTDIDDTIYAGGFSRVVTGALRSAHPLAGAARGVTDLSQNATFVYLTARDDYWTANTKRWLRYWRFPEGPVFLSDGLGLGRDPTAFKTGVVRDLKRQFDVAVAFGNADTDLAAYDRNRVPAILFGADPSKFPTAKGVYRDWDALRRAVQGGAHGSLLGWATQYP